MSKRFITSEWQEEKNPFGGIRRFRMVGNVKEYEMMYRIDGIDVPESQLEEFNRARAEAAERERAEAQKKAEAAARDRELGFCPFKLGANSLHVSCDRKCAFFGENSCALVENAKSTPARPEGLYCPIAGQCRTSCAFYADGCKFINHLKGKRPERK